VDRSIVIVGVGRTGLVSTLHGGHVSELIVNKEGLIPRSIGKSGKIASFGIGVSEQRSRGIGNGEEVPPFIVRVGRNSTVRCNRLNELSFVVIKVHGCTTLRINSFCRKTKGVEIYCSLKIRAGIDLICQEIRRRITEFITYRSQTIVVMGLIYTAQVIIREVLVRTIREGDSLQYG